ncbi:MAG: hypothetical protein JWP97_4393 [Labilithrix sp.]|nr:hypothetical protein [Labilithrix sp.]
MTRLARIACVLVLSVLLGVTGMRHSRAEPARVPLALQAQLTARLGSFDRNFLARAGSTARVLVLHKAGDGDSESSAATFARALTEGKRIAGLPSSVDTTPYADPGTLVARIKAGPVALVYLAAGLEGDMPKIAEGLRGIDVLTVGAAAAFAQGGAVVGFDLEEARPKLVLNLRSAKAQNVAFKAELLELARIAVQ